MTALIISAFVGIVACTAGTFYMFRRELDRQSNALWTCIHDRAEADLLELRNHVTLFGNAIRQETTEVRTHVMALASKDFSDVLTAKNDFLTAVDGLHTKIDAIPAAAHAAAREAAADVMVATRRTCGFCDRLVHSFQVNGGVVKCTDCTAGSKASS